MKIAIWYNLPSGGAKRAIYTHVQGLLARGHEIEVWCPPTADRSFLPLSSMVRENVIPIPAAGLLSRSSHRARRLLGWQSVSRLDLHCRHCAAEIAASSFDVLLATSSLGAVVSSIGRHSEVPSVLYLQEPNRYLYEARPVLPWVPQLESPKWAGLNLLRTLPRLQALRAQAHQEAVNIRGFDLVLANSYFSRENILRSYGVDSQVCYLGVDTNRFVDRKLTREDFVVGVGALSSLKNAELCVEAMGELRRSYGLTPPLVWIANTLKTSYKKFLLDRAQRLGVHLIVKLRISEEELVKTLNKGALLLYAPRLEPFGLAPLEANACGMPVVAAAEGGVRETVLDEVNGLIAPSAPAALASKMFRLLSDRPYARRLGSQASDYVRTTWDASTAVSRLESALLQLLEGVSSGSETDSHMNGTPSP